MPGAVGCRIKTAIHKGIPDKVWVGNGSFGVIGIHVMFKAKSLVRHRTLA